MGDGSVRVWRLSDVHALPELLPDFGGWPLSLAFSPDGDLLAVGGTERTVKIWSFSKHRVIAALRGHEGLVDTIAFARSVPVIASGSADKTVRLWDLTSKDPQPVVFEQEEEAGALEFSPSGRQLLISMGDTTQIRTVSAAILAERVCSVVSRNLSLEEWRAFVGQDYAYERTCSNLPVSGSLLESAQQLARTGAQEEAKSLVALAQKLDPRTTAEWSKQVDAAVAGGLLVQAEELARSGDAAGGAALMRKAMSRGASLPANPETHARQLAAEGLLKQASRLTRAGDADRRMVLLNRSIELMPTAGAFAARGDAWADRGENDKAIADLDRAVSLDGSRWDVHAVRAQVLLRKEDWPGAIQGLSRALEINRDQRRKLRWVPANKLGVVDPGFMQVMEMMGAEADILAMRALASSRLGDQVGALADYGSILSENPKSVPALFGRGVVYNEKGDCEKAVRDLNAALELDAKHWRALAVRGQCLWTLGDHEGGLRDFESAAAFNPGSQEIAKAVQYYRTAGKSRPAAQ
jgi:tetratricopeptide (TPR) repeat protein